MVGILFGLFNGIDVCWIFYYVDLIVFLVMWVVVNIVYFLFGEGVVIGVVVDF